MSSHARPLRLALALALAVALASPLAAADDARVSSVSASLGTDTIELPVLDDFTYPGEVPPVIRDITARATPASNRFIAVMMPRPYLQELMTGKRSYLTRYLVVQTIRAGEQMVMPDNAFEQVRRTFRSDAQALLKRSQDATRARSAQAVHDTGTTLGDPAMTVETGPMKSLGVFDDEPDAIALASVQPITSSSSGGGIRKFNQVSAMAIVAVHRKPLLVTLNAEYESQEDIDWAEQQAREWIRRVRELNR